MPILVRTEDLPIYYGVAAILLVLGIAFIIAGIIASVRAKKKQKTATTFNWTLAVIYCIVISIFGYIMNMGWYRFGLFFIGLPIWYPLLLFFSVTNSAKSLKNRPLAVLLRIASCISYLLPGMLLYDGADIGPYYFFFGLFDAAGFYTELSFMAISAFVFSLVIMYIQYAWSKKVKKSEPKPSTFMTRTEPQTDTNAAEAYFAATYVAEKKPEAESVLTATPVLLAADDAVIQTLPAEAENTADLNDGNNG